MRKRALQAIGWTLSGTVSQAIAKIIVLLALVRLLTPSEFGTVSAALVVTSICTSIAIVGIGPAIVQRRGITDEHLRVADGLSIIMGTTITAGVFFGSGAVEAFFRIEGLSTIVATMSVLCLLQALTSMPLGYMQRNLRFKELAAIDLASYAIGYGLVSLGFALAGAGAWSLVLGYIGQATIQFVATRTLAKQFKLPSLNRRIARDLLAFGLGFLAGKIFRYSATEGDNLVIGRWLGADALGLYGRAYHLLVLPAMLVGKGVNKVLFPYVSRIQDDRTRVARVLCDALFLLSLTLIPLGTYCIAIANELVLVLLGESWIGVVAPFQVLATVMLCRTAGGVLTALADAQGAVYRRASLDLIYGFLVVLGASVGLRWGVVGVASGVSLALLTNYILMVTLVVRTSGARIREVIFTHVPGIAIGVLGGPMTHHLLNQLRELGVPVSARLLVGTLVFLLISSMIAAAFYRFAQIESVDRLKGMFRNLRRPPQKSQALVP